MKAGSVARDASPGAALPRPVGGGSGARDASPGEAASHLFFCVPLLPRLFDLLD